jgi:fumarate hydratase class II
MSTQNNKKNQPKPNKDTIGTLIIGDFRHWREQTTNSNRYMIRPKRSGDNSLINSIKYPKNADFNENKFLTLSIIHRIYKNCPTYQKNINLFRG